MGIGSWFRGLFGPEKRSGTGFEVSRWTSAPMRRGTPELLQAYKEIPWLNTLVDTVSDSVANVQWKVYRPSTKGDARARLRNLRSLEGEKRRAALKAMVDSGEAIEVPSHPVLQLMSNPSDHLTGRQVAKLVQTHLDLVGEAFLVLDLSGNLPVGYWPLPPNAVTQLPDYNLPPAERFYRVNFGRMYAQVPADRVLHLRNPDPLDPMGRGVGKGFTLGDELDTDEYAARFAKNFFYNNAIPAAVMAIEGLPSGDQPNVKKFKEDIQREYRGAENAGKLMITGGKVSVARLDTDFQKMDLAALRKGGRDFTRMNFRVPPEVVGDLTSSNKATAWAAHDALAQNCTVPRAEFLRSEYQLRLMPRLGSSDDFLDYESPIPADQELQLRVMGTFPSSFTHNEARELAGKKPDPKLKGYLAPLPGQVEAGPKTPDAEQGGEADTIEEQNQPSNKGRSLVVVPKDPPWAVPL